MQGLTAIRQAVFRADASVEIGGGHVMRCLTLAKALESTGWNCAFATDARSHLTIPALAEMNRLTLAGPAAGEPAALARKWPDGCDLLVVDHYRRDAAFERACRPWARRIMAIDDLADRRHDCDFLLDQSLGRKAAEYERLTPVGCCLLMGPKYALLRQQFARTKADSKCHVGPVRRILVAMGGTDPLDATSAALKWIRDAAPSVEVTVLLGESAPHRERIEAIASTSSQSIHLHIGVDDVASLMATANLSIGAAGSTSWERCAMGLPTLIVILAQNQVTIAAALDSAGAAISLGHFQDIDDTEAVRALRQICASGEHRFAMSHHATKICDGRGVERIAVALAV